MCGIAGIFNLHQPHPIEPTLLAQINNAQLHRGPDDEGYYIDEHVGLAHRRLSIIDLSSGHQPIFNEDDSVVIVFNGEIYNYQALYDELTQLGHTFKTVSDTEVIVHAWEEWQEQCLSRFTGMFAFALWDKNRHQLFIARDRVGKKPLHYTVTAEGQFVFGSELKVLTSHPKVSRTKRTQHLEDFLHFGYVPDPYTAYQDIFTLEAGHFLLLSPGQEFKQQQYWDLTYSPTILDEQQAKEALIEELQQAIAYRLIADVPLGAFLSGGVDSSAMVALIAQQQSSPLQTCSIGFSDKQYDESSYATAMAKRYKTNHHSQEVDSSELMDLSALQDMYDQPFADSSSLPTWKVCQMARKHVKVAISGDGGDELFAGYRRHRLLLAENKIKGKIPASIRQPLFGTLGKLYPKMDWAPQPLRAKTTFQSLGMSMLDGYAHGISKMSAPLRHSLYSQQYMSDLQGYSANEHLLRYKDSLPDDPLKQIQYLDFKTWLPGDILTKVDRASMATSLEVRAPLLDHNFIEWGFGLPSHFNIQKEQGKSLFKKSLEPWVDNDILYRPKMGFSMPIAKWFRHELADKLRQTVLSEAMLDSGQFSSQQLSTLVNDHQSGRSDHSASLWSLWMYAQFLQAQG
jgi:asparagine synthase (glutamine-hydrolysing)